MNKLILTFFSILPLRLNHFIGSLIGWYSYLARSQSRLIASKNIEICFPDLNKQEQQQLIKKSLIEIGKSLSESGFVWFNSFSNNAAYINKINGKSHVTQQGPIIFLVPHFGCWELTGRIISRLRPITFLYKILKNSKEEAFVLSARQQENLQMVPANKQGVFKLQRILSDQGVVGILPDQNPDKDSGIFAPFFGHNVKTMTLLAKLARKNKATVLMTWAERLPKGRGYELNLKPIEILSETGHLEDDVILMNKAIESLIKTQPEQYLWNYKRFKSVIKY